MSASSLLLLAASLLAADASRVVMSNFFGKANLVPDEDQNHQTQQKATLLIDTPVTAPNLPKSLNVMAVRMTGWRSELDPAAEEPLVKKHEVKITKPDSMPKSLADAMSTHHEAAEAESEGGAFTYAELGPFEDHAAACSYCYQSHTRTSVVKNCICTAYTGDDGPTMFCTGSRPGVNYASKKDGACKCVEKDMQQQGKTTCVPWE